jgi:hypothetical protein
MALRILPIIGRGGMHDIRDVLALPGVDMGIVPEHVLVRLQESKELGDIRSKLVYITGLFKEEFHIIARGDIRQISELAGQSVNVGEQDGSSAYMARDLFKGLGLKVTETHLTQDEALEEMGQGKIAATVFLAPKPAPQMERFSRNAGFHLIPISFPADTTPYLPTSLRHEDYPNLIPPGEAVETAAVGTVLIAYNWAEKSSRYRLLSDFVDAFFSRFPDTQAASRNLKWHEINLAAALPDWQRFRPAERWLQIAQPRQANTVSTGSISRSEMDGGATSDVRNSENERLFEEFMRWREQRDKR